MSKVKKIQKPEKDDSKSDVAVSEEKDSKKSTNSAADVVVKDTTEKVAAELPSSVKDADIRVLYSAQASKLTTRGK